MLIGRTNRQGFTIVELLIVIVVIAILAAISVAAYTGIQNRANDSAVQSDLSNFAKQIQLVAADTGNFPAGGAVRVANSYTGSSTSFPDFKFRPSKEAYMTDSVQNLFYCTGEDTVSGQSVFRIYARSKSRNTFYYNSATGPGALGTNAISNSVACSDLADGHSWAYGYYSINDVWWSWTNA